MNYLRLKIYTLLITLAVLSQNAFGLDIESELKHGFDAYQNFRFEEALRHLEPIIDLVPNEENGVKSILYYLCASAAQVINDTPKSILYFERSIKAGDLPNEYESEALCGLLTAYEESGNRGKCESIVRSLTERLHDQKSLTILRTLCSYHSQVRQYEEVIKLEPELWHIDTSVSTNDISKIADTIDWNTVYTCLATSFFETGDYSNALSYYDKALSTLTPEIEDSKYNIYNNMASCQLELGHHKSALEYQTLAMSEGKEMPNLLPEDIRLRATQHLNLGLYRIENEDYRGAIDPLEESAELFDSIADVDCHAYALSLLFHAYSELGEKEKYLAIGQILTGLVEDNKIQNNEIALIVSSNIGKSLEGRGEQESALNFYLSQLPLVEQIYVDKIEIIPYYYRIASLYLKRNNIDEALGYIAKLRTLCDRYKDRMLRRDYFGIIQLEVECRHKKGQDGQAVALLESLCEEIESVSDLPETKSSIYSALSGMYLAMGDSQKALSYSRKSLDLCGEYSGHESESYAIKLLNYSETCAMAGNIDEAVVSSGKACETIEKLHGERSPLYYKALSKQAGQYEELNPDYSRQLYRRCLYLAKDLFGKESNEYAECLVWSTCIFKPSYTRGITVLEEALNTKRRLGFTHDQTYSALLSWLSILYVITENWDRAYEVSAEVMENIRQYIASNFRHLSEQQREPMWKNIRQSIDHIESAAANYSQYAVENADYHLVDSFGSLAYDSRLLKKGFLLNSSNELNSLIAQSANPDVRSLTARIDSLNALHAAAATDISRLKAQAQINNSERELISLVSGEGDFIDFISMTSADLRHYLKPHEAAIEFFSYNAQDKVQYAAVWMTASSEPLAITLFCEDELDKYVVGGEAYYDYSDPGLYNIVWSSLEVFSDIRNAESIYFSPDNRLNSINIEILRDSVGTRACDKHKLYRLTSTREIMKKAAPHPVAYPAVLYGGLDYDASLSSGNMEAHPADAPPASRFSGSRTLRGHADFLEWSLKEVEKISGILDSSQCHVYTGNTGTEESIKTVGTLHPSLLHIATHGFYYNEDEIRAKLKKYTFLKQQNDTEPSIESLAMRGSGLLLSGANHSLSGDVIPDYAEDGILTADEIAHLNLQDVELVVLSGCETGLGKACTEGVFGMQRGFKLSGAHSLLMSLWQVDDKATALLMEHFYKNLRKGNSKRESLKEAQNYIRSLPRYSKPVYWASWILLDAL